MRRREIQLGGGKGEERENSWNGEKEKNGKSTEHIINMLLSDNQISVGKRMKPENLKLLCSPVSSYHWQVGQVCYSSCSRENFSHFKTIATGMSLPDRRTPYHLLIFF